MSSVHSKQLSMKWQQIPETEAYKSTVFTARRYEGFNILTLPDGVSPNDRWIVQYFIVKQFPVNFDGMGHYDVYVTYARHLSDEDTRELYEYIRQFARENRMTFAEAVKWESSQYESMHQWYRTPETEKVWGPLSFETISLEGLQRELELHMQENHKDIKPWVETDKINRPYIPWQAC